MWGNVLGRVSVSLGVTGLQWLLLVRFARVGGVPAGPLTRLPHTAREGQPTHLSYLIARALHWRCRLDGSEQSVVVPWRGGTRNALPRHLYKIPGVSLQC